MIEDGGYDASVEHGAVAPVGRNKGLVSEFRSACSLARWRHRADEKITHMLMLGHHRVAPSGRHPAPLGGRGSRARLRMQAVSGLAVFSVAAGWPAAAHSGTSQSMAMAGQVRTLVRSASILVPVPGGQTGSPEVAPLRHLLHADLIVVAPGTLPWNVVAAIRRSPGVRAAEPVDAAKIQVNGTYAAVLGVDPSRFRAFADRPTARDTALWRSVASGDIAVSYDMGRHAKLPAGTLVSVTGRQQETLLVGGLGTVGIAGVDGVVSTTVAGTLGFPVHNALVVSISSARMKAAVRRIKAAVPQTAVVEQLVVPGSPSSAGRAGMVTAPAGGQPAGAQLTSAQALIMLRAAVSRIGMPYVWGAAGPRSFDCSGLVQWAFHQAGVVMPRVAADQARSGPAVPVSQLRPGDLLFYHTDPTAPSYISHVAIYLGGGRMIQAPQPGMTVEIVPADLGSEFAGAVAVSPAIAAGVAAAPMG